MTKSDDINIQAEQPLTKLESNTVKTRTRTSRRKITLFFITFLLNVLVWSAVICLVTSLYQIISDPRDTTNIAPVVLNTTSALATIVYAFVHTVFSLKQKTWEQQQRHNSAFTKTSYVAIRLVVSLCVLWLLTSGWNMIIVARRPVCLEEASGLEGWEFGSICLWSRVGITFAAIALLASCVLFGVLALVNRPFEAHLFNHGYREPANTRHSSYLSCASLPTEDQACTCEKCAHCAQSTAPTQRSVSFDSMIPSTTRSPESGVYTSSHAPPPIPSAYIASQRNSSFDTSTSVFRLSTGHGPLARPLGRSASANNSDFAPLSIQARYSASTWRAVHPEGPKSIVPSSRPRPHSRDFDASYRTQYSRSSVSLTRPTRLSSLSSVSRSGSNGSKSRHDHFSGRTDGSERATSGEIAFAISRGMPIPGTEAMRSPKRHHMRTASAPHVAFAAQRKTHFELNTVIITRKPVPARRLRSADRKRTSNAFASAAKDMTNLAPEDLQYFRNSLTSAELERRRRSMLEEVKNKPLPKIAIF